MTEEARTWQEFLPAGAELCPKCYTNNGTFTAWQAAEAEYQRQMDPRLHDGPPSRGVKTPRTALELALQRRRECREGHDDAGG